MNNEVIEIESTPTKIKYKGVVWIPEPKEPQRIPKEIPKEIKEIVKKTKTVDNININFTMPREKPRVKKPYLVKWLEKSKNIGDVFTLDEFYGKYPKHKKDQNCKKRVDKLIASMIVDKRIIQIGNNRFKLVQ